MNKTKKYFQIILVMLAMLMTACDEMELPAGVIEGIKEVADEFLGDKKTEIDEDVELGMIKNEDGTLVPDPAFQTIPETVRIEVLMQEYGGENIIEIPYIIYEGYDQNIENINDSVYELVNKVLNTDFGGEESKLVNIRTYPVSDQNYEQFILMEQWEPADNQGWSMISFCYDKTNGKLLNTSEFSESLGLTKTQVKEAAANLLQISEADSIASVEGCGLVKLPEYDQIFFQIKLEDSEGTITSHCLSYRTDTGEFDLPEMNRLVDYSYLMSFDPPLYYEQ